MRSLGHCDATRTIDHNSLDRPDWHPNRVRGVGHDSVTELATSRLQFLLACNNANQHVEEQDMNGARIEILEIARLLRHW